MARTKQTARVSTGNKTPRQHLLATPGDAVRRRDAILETWAGILPENQWITQYTEGSPDFITNSTLARMEMNDPELQVVNACGEATDAPSGFLRVQVSDYRVGPDKMWDGEIFSSKGSDIARLGNCLSQNTEIRQLNICGHEPITNSPPWDAFEEGMKSNASVKYLEFQNCDLGSEATLGHHVLRSLVQSEHIRTMAISGSLGAAPGGAHTLASALASCRHLMGFRMTRCGDAESEDMVEIISALRWSGVRKLSLHGCHLHKDGSAAIATLLSCPYSNLDYLRLSHVGFDSEHLSLIIEKGLYRNKKLKSLLCFGDYRLTSAGTRHLEEVLCDTRGDFIACFASNHTLEKFAGVSVTPKAQKWLDVNGDRSKTKTEVALQKVEETFGQVPQLDLSSLLEGWEERAIKLLPHVADWGGRGTDFGGWYWDERTKHEASRLQLSAIYQIVRGSPAQCVEAHST